MAATAGTAEDISTSDQADGITKSYSKWAAGAGLIPFPYVDLAVILGIQMKMLSDMSKVYETPFSANAGKSAVTALLVTVIPAGYAASATSLVKMVPGVGTILGAAVAPTAGFAATYAIGKVFKKHFESGGTMLSFDADEMRDHFKAEFESARSSQKKSTSS